MQTVTRQSIMQQVMLLPEVQQQIRESAEQNGRGLTATTRTAFSLLDGIAANINSTTIQLLTPCFSWLWRRLYTHLEIHGLEQLSTLQRDHQLIYLPCHRSHMDYLLLTWVLHQHGLTLPHVAAGDNLNMPIIGPVLQRCGAVFMRRKFYGDALYSTLFKGYLKQLTARGLPLEFFPEGGRSRTGRLLPARTGLLSMLLDNQQHNAHKTPALLPVWISYDQIPEIPSYLHQLSGQSKQPETLGGVIKSLRLLVRKLGEAQLVFGDAILLPESGSQPDARELGETVLCRINQSAAINQSSLLATVLLHQGKHQMSRNQLDQRLLDLHRLLQSLPGYSGSLATPAPDEWIQSARKRDQLSKQGDDLWLTAAQAAEMTYYRNTIIHLLILPGLYLLLAHRMDRANAHRINRIIRLLYPFLRAEMFLPWTEQTLTPTLRQIRQQLVERELLTALPGNCWQTTDQPLALLLQRLSEQILLRYYIVLRILAHDVQISEDDLIHYSGSIARRLQQEYGHPADEYADKRVLQSFISQLKHQGLLQPDNDRLHLMTNPTELLDQAAQFLPGHLLSLIQQQLDIG